MPNFKYNGCIKYTHVNSKKKISPNAADFVCNVRVLLRLNAIMRLRI